MNNYKTWIIAGGIFGFLGVAIGAFGAHSLKGMLAPEMMEAFKTGVMYQLIHSVVILAIGLTAKEKFYLPALFFNIGILLFSFSLYLYSLTYTLAFAMITPLGGVSFLIGWALVVVKGIMNKE